MIRLKDILLEGLSKDEARNKILEYDEGKKNYYLNVFQKQPLDPSIFNIIFNSELLSEDDEKLSNEKNQEIKMTAPVTQIEKNGNNIYIPYGCSRGVRYIIGNGKECYIKKPN